MTQPPTPPVGDLPAADVSTFVAEAAKARKTGKPVELMSERSATSRTSVLPSGTMRTDISLSPMHFRDAKGDWQVVANDLVADNEAGFAWRNTAAGYRVQFPASLADGPVKITSDGDWLTLQLPGATGTGVVDGATVTYREAYPGVDVAFTATGDSVTKLITLRNSSAQNAFPLVLGSSDGVAGTARHGGLSFGKGGRDEFVLPEPWAIDAHDTLSGFDGPVTLASPRVSAGEITTTLTVDPAWLDAPERVFPVTVDPTVQLPSAGAIYDCHIVSGVPGTSYADNNYCASTVLEVGSSIQHGHRRSLFRLDTTAIPREAVVLDAKVDLTVSAAYPNNATSGYTVNAHKITQDWAYGNVTWNQANPATGQDWTTPGGTYSSTVAGSVALTLTDGQQYELFARNLFQDWVSWPGDNHGMLLKQASEPNSSAIMRIDATDSTNGDRPTATVLWTPRLGQQSFDTIISERLSDRANLGVNVANGNLLVHHTDARITGTGQDLIVDRTYNSLAHRSGGNGPTGTTVGVGWSTDLGGDMWLEPLLDGKSMALHGPGGVVLPFHKSGSSSLGEAGWRSPPATSASLSYDSANDVFTVTLKKQNAKYRFSAASLTSPGVLTEVTDRNGNTIAVTARTSGYPAELTDTQGREHDLTINNYGLRSGMTDSAGRSYGYGHAFGADGFLLTSYTAPGASRSVEYLYAGGSGVLTGIDIPLDANRTAQTRISYYGAGEGVDGDDEGKVRHVDRYYTTPAGSLDKVRTSYTYRKNTSGEPVTEVTDPRGNTTSYVLDTKLRVKKVTDAKGHEQSKTYNPDSQVASFTNAIGGTTNLAYDANNNESLTSITTATGAKNSFAYPAPSDPAGANNGNYLPKSRTDSVGNTTTFSYNGPGNPITTTGPSSGGGLSAVSTTVYNDDGTVKAETTFRNKGDMPAGSRPECKSADSGSDTDDCTSYTYTYATTGAPVLTKMVVTPPERAVWQNLTTTNYDALTRASSVIDGKGITIDYGYDPQDRVTTVTHGNGTITSTYDLAGNLLTQQEGAGTTAFAYDELNRMTARNNVPGLLDLSYAYDKAGNLTKAAVGTNTTSVEEFSYAYDPQLNLLTSLAEPPIWGTGRTTTFGYDEAQRRRLTSYPGGAVQVVRYDDDGKIRTIIVGKGTYNFTTETFTGRKDAHLLYCYSTGKGTTPNTPTCATSPSDTSPTGAGHDTGRRQWIYDSVTGETTTYTYTAERRLRRARTTNASGTQVEEYEYLYDGNGNRVHDSDQSTGRRLVYDAADALCLTDSTTDGSIPTYSSSRHRCTTNSSTGAPVPADAALTTYAYDGIGANTMVRTTSDTATSEWNARGQLSQMYPFGSGPYPTDFDYVGSGNGDRTSRYADFDTTHYANGLLGLQAENDAAGRTTTIRDPEGTLIGLRRPNGAASYYQLDAQGSVIGLTDTAGTRVATYTYDPYGAHHTATGSAAADNPYRYTGGYLDDSTGLYKLGIRYYDPSIGRFTQPDPTGQDHQYLYAACDPVNFLDPGGAGVCANLGYTAAGFASVGAFFGALTATPLAPAAGPTAAVATVGAGVFGLSAAICSIFS